MARVREVRFIQDGMFGRREERVRDLEADEKPPKDSEPAADDAKPHDWRPVKG